MIVFSTFCLFLILTLFLPSAEMTTKFNQELKAKIKAKKNKPFFSIGARRLRVVEKEKEKEVIEKGSSTPTLDEGRLAFQVSPSRRSFPEPRSSRLETMEKRK